MLGVEIEKAEKYLAHFNSLNITGTILFPVSNNFFINCGK
jgi:hypothetical protein